MDSPHLVITTCHSVDTIRREKKIITEDDHLAYGSSFDVDVEEQRDVELGHLSASG